MANDNTLAIRLEARIRDFEKNLARATKSAGREFGSIEKRAEASSAKLKGMFSNFGKGLFAGIAAGGVAGIVTGFQQMAKSVAEVGDQAKLAGVSIRTFSEWETVARQARIPVDAMADAFKELAIRSDEFATTGKGSAAEAFARLGLTPQEVKERIKDPGEFMLLLIERTKQLKDTAAGTRIFDELMGGQGGERFTSLIDKGEAGIRAMIDQAHRLGIVMDEGMVKQAAEIDQQFQIISQTVGTKLQQAIVTATGLLIQFMDRFRDFENRQSSSLDMNLRLLGKERLDIETQILQLRQQQDEAGSIWLGGGMSSATAQQQIDLLKDQDAALAEQEAQILAVIEARRALTATPIAGSNTTDWKPLPSAGANKTPKEKFTPDPQAFRAMLGYTTEYVAAQELANDRLEYFGDLATSAANSLATAFSDGKLEASEISSIIGQIAQQLLTLEGIKMIGSLFGFGMKDGGLVPGFASGGRVSGPGGPRGDKIPAMLSDGEFVVNAKATRRHAGLLEAVNDNRFPAFANGGPVGVPQISAPRVPSMSSGGGGSGGTSVVELRLSPELTAQILAEARGQSIKISQDTTRQGLASYDKTKQRQQMTGG